MRFVDLKLFLLLFACVGGAVVYESPVRFRTLVESRDQWDLAIAGPGYFEVTDPESAENFYTRSGKLRLNIHGQLCILVEGTEWLLVPGISIPQDARGIVINEEGHILSNQSEVLANIGQLQLTKFQPQARFANDFAANAYDLEKHGMRVIASPGTGGNGQILQGWLEQPAESATYRYAKPILIGSVLAVVLKVLLDAVIAQQKMQKLLQTRQSSIELQ
jgi:flagellar basal body rod protein FlgF